VVGSGGTATLSCTFTPTAAGACSFADIIYTGGPPTDTLPWQTGFRVGDLAKHI
jgi:hypothetical protein